MNELENIIYQLKNTPTDINEHIETLVKYASQCDHVTEMGVRGIFSTWAFVASKPKKIISYDLYNPSKYGGNINNVYTLAKKYNIEFLKNYGEKELSIIKRENNIEQVKKSVVENKTTSTSNSSISAPKAPRKITTAATKIQTTPRKTSTSTSRTSKK